MLPAGGIRKGGTPGHRSSDQGVLFGMWRSGFLPQKHGWLRARMPSSWGPPGMLTRCGAPATRGCGIRVGPGVPFRRHPRVAGLEPSQMPRAKNCYSGRVSSLKPENRASGLLTSNFILYTSNFRWLAVRPTDKKLGIMAKSGVFVNFSS
jgi:hypothetical protein